MGAVLPFDGEQSANQENNVCQAKSKKPAEHFTSQQRELSALLSTEISCGQKDIRLQGNMHEPEGIFIFGAEESTTFSQTTEVHSDSNYMKSGTRVPCRNN